MTREGDRDPPLGAEAFELLADEFAARVETKAHNAYYEKPAMLALLPEVAGMRVLDAGCGPGVYAEWLLEHGATVVGIDVSQRMIELARSRVGQRAEFFCANLEEPIGFLEDESFDLVLSALSVDYVRDLGRLFAEYHRVLRDGGRFVFSKEHPFSDFTRRHLEHYFETEIIGCTWRGFGKPVMVRSYRRPLSELLNALTGAGFTLERVVEPRPTEEFKEADPEDYAKLMEWPGFLCIRARKLPAGP